MTLWLRDDFAKAWKGDDPFSRVDALEGKDYRNVKTRRTLRFEFQDQGFFAKIHHGVGWGEIFKNLLSLKLPILGAENEWLAIERLKELNIDTMTAVGYGSRGLSPASRHSFILTEALDNTISLEDYCVDWGKNKPHFPNKLRLLRQIAATSKTLHENGICHRDYYLCHFLLHEEDAFTRGDVDAPKLSLIDLHRVLIHKNLHRRWIVKDIAGLYFSAMHIGLTQRDLFRFVRLYSGKKLKHALLDDAAYWSEVRRKAVALDRKVNRAQENAA